MLPSSLSSTQPCTRVTCCAHVQIRMREFDFLRRTRVSDAGSVFISAAIQKHIQTIISFKYIFYATRAWPRPHLWTNEPNRSNTPLWSSSMRRLCFYYSLIFSNSNNFAVTITVSQSFGLYESTNCMDFTPVLYTLYIHTHIQSCSPLLEPVHCCSLLFIIRSVVSNTHKKINRLIFFRKIFYIMHLNFMGANNCKQ